MTKTKSVPIKATWYKTHSGKYYMGETLTIDVPEELMAADASTLGARYLKAHELARKAVLERCDDPCLFAVVEDVDADCPAGDEHDVLCFPEAVYPPERKAAEDEAADLRELASTLLATVRTQCLSCPDGNATPSRPCTNPNCGLQDAFRRAETLGVS